MAPPVSLHYLALKNLIDKMDSVSKNLAYLGYYHERYFINTFIDSELINSYFLQQNFPFSKFYCKNLSRLIRTKCKKYLFNFIQILKSYYSHFLIVIVSIPKAAFVLNHYVIIYKYVFLKRLASIANQRQISYTLFNT